MTVCAGRRVPEDLTPWVQATTDALANGLSDHYTAAFFRTLLCYFMASRRLL